MYRPTEDAYLRYNYHKASRAELLQQLPNRTWLAITSHAGDKGLHRNLYVNDATIPRWLSLVDVDIIEKYGLKLTEPTALGCWWKEGVCTWEKADLNQLTVSTCSNNQYQIIA